MTAKSDRVRKLLEDQDLKDAFHSVREHYRDAIERTPVDKDGGELVLDIRKMLHLLREVEQSLFTALQDGELEDFNAVEQEKQSLIGRTLDGIRNH